jgi:hypothetical protein
VNGPRTRPPWRWESGGTSGREDLLHDQHGAEREEHGSSFPTCIRAGERRGVEQTLPILRSSSWITSFRRDGTKKV